MKIAILSLVAMLAGASPASTASAEYSYRNPAERAAWCADFPVTVQKSLKKRFPQTETVGQASFIALNSHEGVKVTVYNTSTGCLAEPVWYSLEEISVENLDRVQAAAVPDFAKATATHVPVYILIETDSSEPGSRLTTTYLALSVMLAREP